VQALALALRFLLELGALAALAWWGFSVGNGIWAVVLGLGAPLLAVAVWGTLAAPKGRFDGRDPQRLVGEVLVFGAGTAALIDLGQTWLAVVFAALAVVQAVLVRRPAPAG
jgi:hypothetical protein